jgi:hypothetical protein
MNQSEKETITAQVKAEQQALKDLESAYKKARRDCQDKIRQLNARKRMGDPNIASVIHQKKYQEQLLKQINGVLDDLQTHTYQTANDFFQGSYQRGYVGSIYELHKQGIPITVPVSTKKMMTAIQTKSKLSQSYYLKQGLTVQNIRTLKKQIASECTRGIASGKSWLEVAESLTIQRCFQISESDAMRIVRTEGNRINQQGRVDAGDEAVKRGCDLLKQWDATLDGRTRPAHREADGQIVEWDDYFTVMGEKLKAPSIGGSASNVINCRCQLLKRPRWALDEEELQTLKDRAEFYGLDKTKDFESFQDRFLKLPENADTVSVEPPDLLGFKKTKGHHSLEDDLAKINPNYRSHRDYQNNCGYCSVGFEMTRRGYDVEANPKNGLYLREWEGMFKCFKPLKVKAKRKSTAVKEIEETVKSWGDGARGGVFVVWDGRSWGHFFAVENVDGEVVFVDGQNNKRGEYVREYFQRAKPSSIVYGRFDDLEPNESNIKKALKNRGE